MLELCMLIVFAILFVLSLWLGPVLLTPLQSWLALDKTLWALLIGLTVYLMVVGMVASIRRYIGHSAVTSPAQRFSTTTAGSLAWLGHLFVPAILIPGAAYLSILRPELNPLFLGILLCYGVVLLGTWMWAQLLLRAAPRPATNLAGEPHAGYIDLSWHPSDDEGYLESRLIRTPPSFVPINPFQINPAVYQGVLAEYKDDQVAAGELYLYTLFTLDGRGRFSTTVAGPYATLPPPDPPLDVTSTADLDSIQLTWQLINAYAIYKVEITWSRIGSDGPVEQQAYSLDPCETWTHSGLESGTIMEYIVSTIDADQQRSSAPPLRTATQVLPPEAKIEVRNRNHVSLSWKLPTGRSDLQYISITRVREDGLDEPDVFRSQDSAHIDHGPIGQGLAYNTAYLYTLEVHYTDPVKSQSRPMRVITLPPVPGIKPEDLYVLATRREIMLRWTFSAEGHPQYIHIIKSWHDLTSGGEHREERKEEPLTQFIDRQVDPGISYSYEITVQTQDGHHSAPVSISAELQPPLEPVRNAKVSRPVPQLPVTLTWQLPHDPTIVGTHIVRQQGKPPARPDDGQIIHHGPESQATDTAATPNHLYIYAFYTFDQEDSYSDRVCKRLSPILHMSVFYVNLGQRERRFLPADLPIYKLVGPLLKGQNIQVSTVDDWHVTIEDTGQEIKPEQTLTEAGCREGQTLKIAFVTAESPGEDKSPQGPASRPSDDFPADDFPTDEPPAGGKLPDAPPSAGRPGGALSADPSLQNDDPSTSDHVLHGGIPATPAQSKNVTAPQETPDVDTGASTTPPALSADASMAPVAKLPAPPALTAPLAMQMGRYHTPASTGA